jgi:hypothetical protein
MINLHPGQSEVIHDMFVSQINRYGVVCGGRGWGKSYLAATAAILAVQELVEMPADIPNKNVAIICPTYQQSVDIYFPLIAYQMGMDAYCDKSSQHSGTFWFPNNVTLKLWSYEASQRLRGSGQYFVVCDEVTTWRGGGSSLKESWESVIQPCLTTRWSQDRADEYGAKSAGRALIISTPMGKDFFYEMHNFEERDNQWKSYHFTYRDSPYLDAKEIERTKHTIDHFQFKREYEASFDDSGNTIFYNFNRSEHVDKHLPEFMEGEDVHIAIDFNVSIMAASVFALRGGQMHFIDEFMGHPDTESLAKEIEKKYIQKGHRVQCYPDPSGRARKSSAAVGRTDFSILTSYNIACNARSKAPPIVDSVQAVNRMLKTGDDSVHMFFHPRCKHTIKSMERTVWRENTPDNLSIDKSEGIEHFSDGIRYSTEFLFPVTAGTKVVSKQSYNF